MTVYINFNVNIKLIVFATEACKMSDYRNEKDIFFYKGYFFLS